jgi:hypothetical protein
MDAQGGAAHLDHISQLLLAGILAEAVWRFRVHSAGSAERKRLQGTPSALPYLFIIARRSFCETKESCGRTSEPRRRQPMQGVCGACGTSRRACLVAVEQSKGRGVVLHC